MTDVRTARRVWVTALVVLSIGWSGFAFVVVPNLIRSAYRGESLPALNALITGQAENGVRVYLGLWRKAALAATAALVAGLVLAALAYRFRAPLDSLRARVLQSGPTLGLPATLMVSAWAGLGFGLLESGGRALTRRGEGIFEYWSNPDYWWMTPTAAAVLFIASGLVLYLVARGRRGGLSLRALVVILVAVGAYGAVRVMRLGIDDRMLWILALGLGVHLGRSAQDHPNRMLRLVRITAPMLALLVLGAFLWQQPVYRFRAQRSLSGGPVPARGAPSVLLVVLDTVRRENLSLYGYTRPTTPTLEALGRRGAVFDRAFSTAPWTLPSHASMLTGQYPWAQSGGWARPLDDEHLTVAEYVRDRGYATGGFVGNLLYTSAASGLDRGFSTYLDDPVRLDTWLYSAIATRWILNRIRAHIPGGDRGPGRKFAAAVNTEFLGWVDRIGDRPFFAFLNYFDAHGPYEPRFRTEAVGRGGTAPRDSVMVKPSVWRALSEEEQTEVDLYDGAIMSMDRALGELCAELESRGRLENTIVIVTADHGEHFHERDIVIHANSLYSQLVHAPLVIAYPPRVPAGERIEAAVSLRDLPATIADLIEPGAASSFPGRSLLEAPSPGTSIAFSQVVPSFLDEQSGPVSRGPMKSVAVGPYHYILNGDGVEELFDLDHDPAEERDLIAVDSLQPLLPELRARLRAALLPEGLAPGVQGGR
ncbi:MAG: sulfatase-like hydrolase/transferase [Gemmatimonadota bacterium]